MKLTNYPWLRKDTIFAAVPGGILISNASTAFELTGDSSYDLFKKVAPLFDGKVSAAEIQQAVPDSTWQVILQLIQPLEDQGFLRWVPASDFEYVEEEHRAAFQDQIAFLAQYTDNPHAAFADFSSARVTMLGADAVTDSLAFNLRDNGAQNITVATSISETADADLIIMGPTGLHNLEAARASGTPLLVTCAAQEHLWALPVQWQHGAYDWQSGDSSLRRGSLGEKWGDAFASAQRGLPQWDSATSSEAVQRLFGALLSYEVFKGLTGAIPPETAQAVFGLDCMSGETTVSRVTPILEDLDEDLREVFQDHDAAYSWQYEFPSPLTFSVEDSRADEYDDVWWKLSNAVTTPAFEFVDLEFPQIPVKVSALETAFGTVFASNAWTTADARIDALARTYSLALTQDACDGAEARVVIGVDRTAQRAVQNAVELLATELFKTDTSYGEQRRMEVPGRLGDFITAVSSGETRFEELGTIAGLTICRASSGTHYWIAADFDVQSAQARAGIGLLGHQQTGVETTATLTLAPDLANILDSGAEVSVMETKEGWHVACVRASSCETGI